MEMMQSETTMERGGGQTGTVDHLSALPDALLHAILFFLPAPQVVRTCLLSKRWRHLWRSAPHIRIDEQDFGISSKMAHGTLGERWAQFEDFATNLLLFHDNTPSLDEFLLCSHVYNQRHVDRWIRRGIEYHPATLHILIRDRSLDYGYGHHFKLPPMASSSFHRLKKLRLHGVDLDSQFADMLSACPFIEDLELNECKFNGNYSQAYYITDPEKDGIGFL